MTQEYMAGTRTHERSSAGSEARERAGEAYEGAKTAVKTAYDKTADAVQSGYQRTVRYGNKHPQQFSMMAFMAGVGAGTLLAGRFSNHSRTERLASPLIDAFAEIARAFVRR